MSSAGPVRYDGKRWQDADMPDYGETATVEKIVSNNAESGRIDAMLISDGDKKVILTSTDGGIHWAEQIAFTATSITHFYYGTSAGLPSTSGSFQGERFVCRYRANLACAEFIQKKIAEDFDGMHLSDSCLQAILDAYGFDRVMWVLANTVGEGNADGRYSKANKEWAKTFRIPPDSHNSEFCVTSHPAIVNGLVDEVRKA